MRNTWAHSHPARTGLMKMLFPPLCSTQSQRFNNSARCGNEASISWWVTKRAPTQRAYGPYRPMGSYKSWTTASDNGRFNILENAICLVQICTNWNLLHDGQELVQLVQCLLTHVNQDRTMCVFTNSAWEPGFEARLVATRKIFFTASPLPQLRSVFCPILLRYLLKKLKVFLNCWHFCWLGYGWHDCFRVILHSSLNHFSNYPVNLW